MADTTKEKLLITVQEAAFMLSISQRTMYRQIEQGHIHTVKIGGNTRILLEELRQWVKEQRYGTQA